jgi:hypothetical protein
VTHILDVKAWHGKFIHISGRSAICTGIKRTGVYCRGFDTLYKCSDHGSQRPGVLLCRLKGAKIPLDSTQAFKVVRYADRRDRRS